METLQTFWTWAYLLGLSSFFLLVLVVIPLGFRDLIQLFRVLRSGENDDDPS